MAPNHSGPLLKLPHIDEFCSSTHPTTRCFAVTIQLPHARHRRAALERKNQGLVDIGGLFAQGREVGAHDRERFHAGLRAEAAGDLLL